MANIVPFDPFEESFEEFFRPFLFRPVVPGSPMAKVRLKMDVTENDKSYTVKADIPGVRKEDIKVSIDGGQVSISAEVRQEKEEKKGEKVIHSERHYGRVERSFTLAHEIDAANAQAKYADGVLELVLPKSTAARSKQVAVQ